MTDTWRVVLGPEDLPRFRPAKKRPIGPNLPTKNCYHTVSRYGRIVVSGGIKKKLAKCIAKAHEAGAGTPLPTFAQPVSLHLVQYAPRKRNVAGMSGLPYLDSDACLAAVRDALEHAGIVANDALILRNVCESRYRKGQPGLEIELRPM